MQSAVRRLLKELAMEKIKWIEEYLEEALKLAYMEGHEAALRLLDRLLYEEPGYGRLHFTLGVIYYDHADDMRKAEEHFRLAIKFSPEFADTYWYLGTLLYYDERMIESVEVFGEGLKAKRANKSLMYMNMAKAYELEQKFGKAIRFYRKALGHSAELWNCAVLEESIKRCERKKK
jgi:tetratricopeptide (TPR) repeat protein